MNIKRFCSALRISFFFILFFFISLIFLGSNKALATSGCCSWHQGVSYCDTSVGRYVCGDGSYSPSCGCAYYPPVPAFPSEMTIGANNSFLPTSNGTYDIEFTFNNPNNRSVSISMNTAQWADPGPLADTMGATWTLKDVQPNTTQYVNMKATVNGVWSQIESWTIQVPAWVAPTPVPTDTPIAIDTSVDNKPFMFGFFDWLFGLFKSKNTTVPDQATETSPYTCDCSKTCTQITTCAEAYYQLNTCGCSVRDGDRDGIPCENLCQ